MMFELHKLDDSGARLLDGEDDLDTSLEVVEGIHDKCCYLLLFSPIQTLSCENLM